MASFSHGASLEVDRGTGGLDGAWRFDAHSPHEEDSMPTETRIVHDADVDPGALRGKTVAVVGYGNQGRSQALNVRDSGLATVVGNLDDAYAAQARADGFAVLPIAEACARADVIMLLIPDEVMPAVYSESIKPHLRAGAVLDFASGYNVAFGLVEAPADVD